MRALLDGLDLDGAAPDPARRAELNARAASPEGLVALAAELRRRDPDGAAGIDLRNPRRVVRATEIVEDRGSLSARGRGGATRPSVRIGLDASPDLHRGWITERAAAMLRTGLVEETGAALRGGVPAEVLDGCGIGYREALEVLAGRASEAAAAAADRAPDAPLRQGAAHLVPGRPGHGLAAPRSGDDDLDELTARAAALAGSEP